VENDAWEDPDFLKPFEDQGKEITAEENGRITIQLKLAVAKSSITAIERCEWTTFALALPQFARAQRLKPSPHPIGVIQLSRRNRANQQGSILDRVSRRHRFGSMRLQAVILVGSCAEPFG